MEHRLLLEGLVEGWICPYVSEPEGDDETAIIWGCGVEMEASVTLALASRIEDLVWLNGGHVFGVGRGLRRVG